MGHCVFMTNHRLSQLLSFNLFNVHQKLDLSRLSIPRGALDDECFHSCLMLARFKKGINKHTALYVDKVFIHV